MLGPYTTNDEVRAVFGVSEEELLNATLDLPMYEANLRLELRSVGAGLMTDFLAAAAESPMPEVTKDFVDAVHLFAPCAVGVHLAGAVPLFAAKAVTDGKAGVTRHSESPFKEVIDKCLKNYERYRQNLEKAYAAYKNATAPVRTEMPQMLAVVSPASDPVVGT